MKSKNQRRRQKKKDQKQDHNLVATKFAAADAVAVTPAQIEAGISSREPASALTNEPTSSGTKLTILSRKYEWMREDDPLYPMYAEISAKLKRKRPDTEDTLNAHQDVAPAEAGDDPTPPSKKQQRLAAKPSLAYLKSLSAFPERIQWFDADAPHPEFLVRLKSLPRAVQVPNNWLSRQDIPQFAPRPPYTPPDLIKSVSFGPSAGADGATLKPSMAAADVDYDKLHSVFFSEFSDFQPESLLPFGHIVDLNLRRPAFKPSARLQAPLRPTAISPRLRTALGLSGNAPPPWASFVAEHGLAPGYRNQSEPIRLWGESV